MIFIHLCQKCLVERVAALIILRGNAQCLNPMFLCPLQGIRARIVADHHRDFGIGDLACIYCVHNCLQVGAAAGHHHTDS